MPFQCLCHSAGAAGDNTKECAKRHQKGTLSFPGHHHAGDDQQFLPISENQTWNVLPGLYELQKAPQRKGSKMWQCWGPVRSQELGNHSYSGAFLGRFAVIPEKEEFYFSEIV